MSAPKPEWVLKALHVEHPTDLAITEDGLTLGRDASNTVAFDSEQHPEVSAHHCRVALRGGVPVVEDLESTNGTYVGGEAVTRTELHHGDVLQLGSGGPRFAVVRVGEGLDRTEAVSRPSPNKARSVGPETVNLLKRELGLAGPEGLRQTVRARTRRNALLATGMFVLSCGLGLWGYLQIQSDSESDRAEIQEQAEARQRDLLQQLADARSELESLRRFADEVNADKQTWSEEKAELQARRDRLEEDLAALAEGGVAAAEQLELLQDALERNQQELAKYNPLNLEQERLRRVAEVSRSVVMVECKEMLVDPESGAVLHFDFSDAGDFEPNFEGRGREVAWAGSGSGFTLNDQGWILTNAHVVGKKAGNGPNLPPIDLPIEKREELQVVFSGESLRRPATLVDWAGDGDEDLALLKIEPFEGMPHLEAFSLDVPDPELFSDVYLLGFPLGTEALQEENRVIASTFRGILSRFVHGYLQVDAAVHPGNSGGPLIDAQGRVLGVVVGMQQVDEVAGSSSMGFVIPIAAAAKLWPPEG